ncbi:LEM3 (Ligand-effect modulator 3) family protein [Tritrichomonas foetus]|uniref:LEM3 (Ligand-effect modulator 3) family protein n=1 Tax=Tritrichomonas foetus TaxID=1144522 RepID=A0A1J4JVT3_9EUKA|nr:LEM3 (Ligand-effect modulator 3) family protein [Tritrichomonas foetus]|eukprot:OHT03239.1 LEM3 (Ligand-effect modulator 3) family protein [Tritrichomonas foetus]
MSGFFTTHIGGEQKKSFLFKKWRNHVTPRAAIITLLVFGVIFLVFGLSFKFLTDDLAAYRVRYDEICQNVSSPCVVNISVNQHLKGRIALLYQLEGFYQNHRKMFNSKSYPQLAGKYITSYNELSACSPAISKGDSKSPEDLYIPCGLMAKSFFNDYYRWMNTSVGIFSEVNISQESDRQNLYKPINSSYKRGIRLLLDNTDFPGETTNEHFIVWMRAAAMPTFLKLFARCNDCSIPAGNYSIEIRMHYPQSMFHGPRYLVLTAAGGIGSGSSFLAISYITAGGFSLAIALIFLIQMLTCPRPFGDLSSIWEPKLDLANRRNHMIDTLLNEEEDGKMSDDIPLHSFPNTSESESNLYDNSTATNSTIHSKSEAKSKSENKSKNETKSTTENKSTSEGKSKSEKNE